ncbi:MAG TPA: hypothetical protein VGG01_05775 [Xanthobacteraceae bacterium]
MKRMVFRLLDLALAVALSLAIANVGRVRAAEWPRVRASDTLWPGAPLDDPKWPKVSDDEPARIDAAPQGDPAAPVTAPVTIPAPAAASVPAALSGLLKDNDVTGSLGPSWPNTPATFDQRFTSGLQAPSPFAFEFGARYWYSIGQNRFAFTNNIFPSGNPTSTLDWDRMQGHTGEGFFRIDHRPTHLYVKGVVGGGILRGGDMDDLDFLFDQLNFSNTTSAIKGNNIAYGIIDLGYSFDVPSAGVRYGAFVGYHYWREQMTAFGLMCNADQVNNVLCGAAGSVVVPFGTPVDVFQTTWNAIRVGGEARYELDDHWTLSGEVAFVPYAWLTNDDSHLLRTDLGPVPNIVTHGTHGMGGEAEAFINYKVMPHFDIGAGVRYWGIFTNSGSVDFGPTFTPDFPLTKFSTQRYGLMLQAKGTF